VDDRPPPGGALAFTNPRIQRLRRLQGRRGARQEEGAFVVEGAVLVAEAIAAGWAVEAQYHAPGVVPVAGPATFALAAGVAERIAATETPPGLFAVVASRPADASVLSAIDLAVVVDGLADPGNVGTIMRSAEAAGAGAVVVTPGTVDVLNPKVVRASAGAIFHVPVVAATLDDVAGAGLRLIGTSSHRGVPHDEADWSGRIAIVAGHETRGLLPDAPVESWVRIEHRGRAESLNVAMATTVLCFEAARQRR
jgi:TrmH family RNA methyltransferase